MKNVNLATPLLLQGKFNLKFKNSKEFLLQESESLHLVDVQTEEIDVAPVSNKLDAEPSMELLL
jgi:hypothetical protein